MILALFTLILGCWSVISGFNTFNDPNCASVSFGLEGRTVDITCYPRNSVTSGWMPGSLFAILSIFFGICIIFSGYFYLQDVKKKKAAKDSGRILAQELLGEVVGFIPATHYPSRREGNLCWSSDKFFFLPEEPFPNGEDRIGPFLFHEVDVPNFRVPIVNSEGFSLRFGGSIRGLSFSSSSGKLKNLMKVIRKYKENA